MFGWKGHPCANYAFYENNWFWHVGTKFRGKYELHFRDDHWACELYYVVNCCGKTLNSVCLRLHEYKDDDNLELRVNRTLFPWLVGMDMPMFSMPGHPPNAPGVNGL